MLEMANVNDTEEEIVWRPPLRGVSAPVSISRKMVQSLEDKATREKELSQQISKLIKARSKIRMDNYMSTEECGRRSQTERDMEHPRGSKETPRKQSGPRIIANV